MDKRRKGRGKRMEASMGERKEANKMRMPGFTAETSLYETREPYHLEGAWAGGAGGQAVIPQVCWWVGPCLPFVHRRLRCCTSWWPPFVRCSWRSC